jgi:hypothetical protein
MIWNGVIGILIAFSAYLIINTIIATLANGKFTAGWATVADCPAVGTSGGITPTPTPTGIGNPTPTPTATSGLRCNASSISAATQTMVNCVVATANSQNLNLPQPSANQLNAGGHTCNLSTGNISCHYGGTQCNGTGNAADFSLPVSLRTAANWQRLATIVSGCGASSQRCERLSANVGCAGGPDHIHANALSSCGCQ